jgi:TolB-like protein
LNAWGWNLLARLRPRHERGVEKRRKFTKAAGSTQNREAGLSVPRIFQFEDFRLDADRRSLERAGHHLQLRPQAMEVLCYLAKNPGRTISKEELFQQIWPGIAVTDDSLVQCIHDIRDVLEDSGHRIVKTVPRRGYLFAGLITSEKSQDAPTAIGAHEAPADSVHDRPSIAILPFANLGGDPEQEYFSDGIVEDITTALSRSRAFFVIARNSSFTYKGKEIDIKQVGRELGVRYVLEGSVRKSGGRVRVTGQLIEALSGHHLWADRFDGDVADIFDMQDEIVTRVVGAIAPRLEKAEIDRARRGATDNLAAYDLYLRGLANWYRWTKEDNSKALQHFYAAIDKDPDYSTPYGLAASCYFFAKVNDWESSFDEKEIARLIDAAAEIGADDPIALAWAGHVHAFFFKDVERALWLTNRAVELDVNLATAWQRSGWVRGYAGDPDGAIESLNNAIRLDPLDPRVFLTHTAMAFAHFIAGRDDEAADWAAMALRLKPNWHPALRMALASNGMRGRDDEADRVLRAYLRMDPELSIAKICGFYPFSRDVDRQRLIIGLRKAGVPE